METRERLRRKRRSGLMYGLSDGETEKWVDRKYRIKDNVCSGVCIRRNIYLAKIQSREKQMNDYVGN